MISNNFPHLTPIKALETLQNSKLLLSSSGNLSGNPCHISTWFDPNGQNTIYIPLKGQNFDPFPLLGTVSCLPSLIVIEDPNNLPRGWVGPWVQVVSSRAAWSYLAAASWGNPQDQLHILGVTGTNGKTSTSWIVRELLRNSGIPCGLVGTLGAFTHTNAVETAHTTPDPPQLFEFFAKLVAEGTRYCAMEVSSHALVQRKCDPIKYSGAAWTSFSRDHLDFHSNEDSYWQAKNRLFTELMQPTAKKISCSDVYPQPYGITDTYSGHPSPFINHVIVRSVSQSLTHTKLSLTSNNLKICADVPFFGQHSLENIAAAYLLTQDALNGENLESLFPKICPVPGRMEMIENPLGHLTFVDYAHTPDALEKVLTTARSFSKKRIICVFGCGGNRDKGKRPMMGNISGRLADFVVITSDNPRNEDPNSICKDIAGGILGNSYIVEVDRFKAIQYAVACAQPGDTLIIAGKGHENYQEISGKRLPFDDRMVTRQIYLQRETTK